MAQLTSAQLGHNTHPSTLSHVSRKPVPIHHSLASVLVKPRSNSSAPLVAVAEAVQTERPITAQHSTALFGQISVRFVPLRWSSFEHNSTHSRMHAHIMKYDATVRYGIRGVAVCIDAPLGYGFGSGLAIVRLESGD